MQSRAAAAGAVGCAGRRRTKTSMFQLLVLHREGLVGCRLCETLVLNCRLMASTFLCVVRSIMYVSCITHFFIEMLMLEAAKATTETADALRTGAAAMKAMQKARLDVAQVWLLPFIQHFSALDVATRACLNRSFSN